MRDSERVRKIVVGLFAACAGMAGCSAADEDGSTAGNEGGGGFGGSSASSGSGGSAASGASAGSGGLSIGGASGAGTGGSSSSGCEKIDFLFVVDNSVSMENEQSQLVAAFPGFISAIQNTVNAGSDYHIMVADTDEWGRCNTANPWTGIDPGSSTCNSYIKNTVFQECDRTMGAGVVNPAGGFASNKVCGMPLPRRYLQQGDPDPSGAFACAAQVGTAGHSSERPMDSIVAAMAAGINGPGGCNEGFLRDDALLVITFISDDPNYEDAGDAQSWYDAVVAAKKGNPDAVTVVGFTPAFAGCGGGSNIKGAHWAEFVAKFKYNVHASVCAGDYVNTFTQAVTVIDESCDAFVPPVK